ncbi:MAG: LemA family protein [Myxococcales bacterium]|nr:LemA family protein [Myxococcales bacterium]MCB9732728.1 LemA family protein [Deltaproteobacteria bacterium]
MSARREAPREVNYDDVDDVIGIASEMEDVARERLSVEELESVARDLEIPTEYVRPAVDELRRRRAAELAAVAARQRKRRLAFAVAGGVIVALTLWVVVTGSGLSGLVTDAARQRAQVVNVMQRQAATTAGLAGGGGGATERERHAELSGAENRVRVERKRYDDVVAEYNAGAVGFPGGLARTLYGLPKTLPFSTEIGTW